MSSASTGELLQTHAILGCSTIAVIRMLGTHTRCAANRDPCDEVKTCGSKGEVEPTARLPVEHVSSKSVVCSHADSMMLLYSRPSSGFWEGCLRRMSCQEMQASS